MKKIVAINASPRTTWNTSLLVRKAAEGATSEGAQIEVFDLYKLEKFTGCISCFGCKLPNIKVSVSVRMVLPLYWMLSELQMD